MNLSVGNSCLRKACMLKLASHRRWFDTIVIYGLQTFQFYINDSIKLSVWYAVKDGISLNTVNLDCVILESLKKQVRIMPKLFYTFIHDLNSLMYQMRLIFSWATYSIS